MILLDEAVAHLDENARIKLFQDLNESDAQVWATALDKATFKNIPGVIFVTCQNGMISNIVKAENTDV